MIEVFGCQRASFFREVEIVRAEWSVCGEKSSLKDLTSAIRLQLQAIGRRRVDRQLPRRASLPHHRAQVLRRRFDHLPRKCSSHRRSPWLARRLLSWYEREMGQAGLCPDRPCQPLHSIGREGRARASRSIRLALIRLRRSSWAALNASFVFDDSA